MRSWGLSKASHGQQSEDTQVETLVVSFEHTSFSRHSGYFHRGELLPWVAITFSTVHSLSCFFFLLLCSCFHIITLLLVYIHIHMHWVWSLHHGPSSHSRIYTCMCPSWGLAISWHAIIDLTNRDNDNTCMCLHLHHSQRLGLTNCANPAMMFTPWPFMHSNADDHVPSKESRESTTKEVKHEVLMLKIVLLSVNQVFHSLILSFMLLCCWCSGTPLVPCWLTWLQLALHKSMSYYCSYSSVVTV